jgi:hypothetical protein
MYKINLILAVALLMVGCSSRPPEVFASRPLVEVASAEHGERTNDSQLLSSFERSNEGDVFTNGETQYVVISRYFSALGNDCLQYANIQTISNRNLACRSGDSWVIYPWVSSGLISYNGGE